jgi:hypothetical protein
MKPVFYTLVAAAVAVLGTTSCQQSQSRFAANSQANLVVETVEGSGGRTRPALEGGGMPEGVGRVGGNSYYVRNGQATLLTARQRLAQGLTFEGGNRVTLQDGTAVRLNNGDMVTFAGERIPLPPGTQLP